MRAKFLFTACFLPVLLAQQPVWAATDAPVVIKKNFSAAPATANRPTTGRGDQFNFFDSLFGGSKRKFVIEDVPDGPVVSNSNPDAGFEAYQPEKRLPLVDTSLSGASFFEKLSPEVLATLRDETTPISVRAAGIIAHTAHFTHDGAVANAGEFHIGEIHVDGFASRVLAFLGHIAPDALQHAVGFGGAITRNDADGYFGTEIGVKLPHEVHGARVHGGGLVLAPVAQEIVDARHGRGNVAAVFLVGDGELFARVNMHHVQRAGFTTCIAFRRKAGHGCRA